MNDIRQLPEVEPRVETGPVQFGDDWPGVFIRGDNAAGLLMYLESPEPFFSMAIQSLKDLLGESNLTLRPRE